MAWPWTRDIASMYRAGAAGPDSVCIGLGVRQMAWSRTHKTGADVVGPNPVYSELRLEQQAWSRVGSKLWSGDLGPVDGIWPTDPPHTTYWSHGAKRLGTTALVHTLSISLCLSQLDLSWSPHYSSCCSPLTQHLSLSGVCLLAAQTSPSWPCQLVWGWL